MKKLLFTAVLSVLMLITAAAQEIQVKGTVRTSDDGMPLPGVSVVIKGTTQGTLSDQDGNFRLSASTGQVIVFSFIGYRPQEITLTGNNQLNVVLEPDVMKMDEVIVIAYGTARKSSYTGSAQKVSSEQLSVTRSESVDKALIGKATGVRITSLTGDPGSSGDIQIRGIGSITGSTSPLYIVDGVPIVTGKYGNNIISSNVLSSINPQDIESMTVLKDAAAASLYGSRAANGVVIITTRKGREGDTKFSLKASYGVSQIATDSYRQMNGAQYIEYERAAFEGYRLNQLNALVPGSANYNNPSVIQAAKDWVNTNYANLTYVDDPNVSTDWWSAVYGTGFDQDYQLSASGGTEKSRFYASLGHKNVEGIVELTQFRRYTGTFNIESKANKIVELSFNNMLSFSDQTGRGDQTGQAQGIATASPLSLIMSGNPTSKIYNEDGSYNLNANFNSKAKNSLYALQPEQSYTNNKTYRAISSGVITLNLASFLKFRSTNAVDYINVEGFRRWGPTSIDGQSLNGLGERPNSSISQLTTSDIFVFDKKAGKHNINAIAGFEVQSYSSLQIFTSASNYSTDKLEELSVAQPRVATSDKFQKYLQSYIANLNYNYDDRYYLAGSIRFDESSQLGVDNRKALFYSGSASWRFSQEQFLETDWLDDGKIRFSLGTNGNLPGEYYGHLGLYNFGGVYGSESAIWISQPENKSLGWEMSSNMNLGIDLTLFKRLSLSVEYFYKYTRDLLLDVPTSFLTGFASALQNAGEISNRGIETELRFADILSSSFKWNADLSLSTLKSTVEKLPGGNDIIQGDGNHYIYSEGKDLYTFYLPVWHDVDPECGLARFVIDPELPATEDNLTYFYANAKRGMVGKAYPDILGGLTNTFSYKGLTLNVLITYQFGGNMFDYPGYFMNNHGFRIGAFNWAEEVADNYWKKPGDVAKYPRPVAGWSARPDRWSTMNILSTDFIRLKEISLQYSFPSSFANRLGIEDMTASLSATNAAFLYQAVKHVDPEVSLNGYRTVDTPLARVITAGLTINF